MKNKSNKQWHFFYLKHTVPSDNPFTPPPKGDRVGAALTITTTNTLVAGIKIIWPNTYENTFHRPCSHYTI